ncbi:MAG TPA: 1,6-anhydro-N-acetylmuramyl-L-alanine amidase AmpD [Nevskiaceae bacterium]|nr:1,6-anhydro-N-acetylmuramyl-L-alanine amidase AmpD [Nevskiaceae bacterium]
MTAPRPAIVGVPPLPLEIDPATHRLIGVRQLESPHADARPDPADISLLVVHAIALPPETFGGNFVDDLFMGRLDCAAHPYFEGLRGVRVSAHAFVRRDGSVTQFVAFDRRAWHAGESSFDGRSRCNDFSVGVELEGSDTQAFTDAQYISLVRISDALLRRYPQLTPERIAGHADIAPHRKTDPGPHFDWLRFQTELQFPR